jgi:predicted nucleotidyltransferase component of viral defense system
MEAVIEKTEIDAKAEELGVHTTNVQRDYAFGWLLYGLFSRDNPLQSTLALKGGNAFRKAYFEHSRFSNDLDFSTQEALNIDALRDGLMQACIAARETSGIEFLVDESRLSRRAIADDETEIYEARVYFKSFYGEEDVRIRVDLDVMEFDRVFLPIQFRRLIHSYSDSSRCQATLRCFKLEELLASKLKALLGRTHSSDLYDFVHGVFFQKSLNISRMEVLTTFLKKTIYEPAPASARDLLLKLSFETIRALWNEYLVCPKLSRFKFEDAESWFRTVVGEIFALVEPRFAYAGRGIGLSYFPSHVRAEILEAGRLQKLLRFVYDGLERTVEPYALLYKRRVDGVAREYFYGWDLIGGRSHKIGIKSYIAEKMGSVSTLDETFQPRIPVELTKSTGYFSKGFGSTKTFGSHRTTALSNSREFTLVCPYCDKSFKRSKYETKLNEHKDRYGNKCYGRIGYIR